MFQIVAVLAYSLLFQEHRSLLSLFSFAPNSFEYAAALAVGVAQGTNCWFDVVVVDVGVCGMTHQPVCCSHFRSLTLQA